MTKFPVVKVLTILSIACAAPAMAQHKVPSRQKAVSLYCSTIEPGNPYSRVYDYEAWSGWRARGGWDSRGDDACARDPSYDGSRY